MLGNDIQIKQLIGVGDVHLSFLPDQRVYCLIGENGIGKTKCLEALFISYLVHNNDFLSGDYAVFPERHFPFTSYISNLSSKALKPPTGNYYDFEKVFLGTNYHNLPINFVGAQSRGYIRDGSEYNSSISRDSFDGIGVKEERKSSYLDRLITGVESTGLKDLNMDTDIEKWIIQRARSANPYQSVEDNREIEIKTLFDLLSKIDKRIDASFLEISGNNRVFIKVADKKTELSELSSGFASILKIMQSIIAGYSYFTNENNIAHVKGVVFIDEIESHLHTKWQATIIPTLKRLFPNTIFYITTHSAIVLSQLQHGEAYELYRDKEDGVVKTELIEHPNNAAFVDLLKDAFDIDINKLKLARDNAPQQTEAKQALLSLLDEKIKQLEVGQS
ncbi:AAA family ATPase [Psychrobacter sp. Ps2]|uniref:AAA family ATPase n=1 Tax=Psychrobacter sp. Ps2 TaxID=2790956 RepID=UPI001EDF8DC0|nr:AAA family ATPase [Psychrobacter sp. Ps2]MCG3857458.1 ATP-binding protein [Psychrobacter sp. Ps2]